MCSHSRVFSKIQFLTITFFLMIVSWGYCDDTFRLTAEAEPLSSAADCVNVISGEFFQVETDLVMDGVDPLHFSRCYDSGHMFSSMLGFGWGMHLPLGIDHLKATDNHYYMQLDMRQGSWLPFRGKKDKNNIVFKITPEASKHGVSNYSQQGISGQTNVQNIRPELTDTGLKVRMGDGTKRIYHPANYRGRQVYNLNKEILPSQHEIHYVYDNEYFPVNMHVTPRLLKGKPHEGIFGELQFDYGGKDKEGEYWNVYTAGGHYASYHLKTHKMKIGGIFHSKTYYETFLTKVERSQKPNVEYFPSKKRKKNGALRIGKVAYPEDRFKIINYHSNGKVAELLSPVGADHNPIVTHTFDYHHDYTTIADAHKNLTHYHFDKHEKRIETIEHCEGSTPRYWEKFIWHEEEEKKGWLKAKILGEGLKAINKVEYFYDSYGNVTKEVYHGNITGQASDTFKIDHKGNMLSATESYAILRAFSQDGYNLVLHETFPEKRDITYTYVHKTNLPKTVFIFSNGERQNRKFYEYDEYHLLTVVIEDDGCDEDIQSLNKVTVRTITRFHPIYDPHSPSYGKPQHIVENAFDLDAKCEIRLKRRQFTYDECARVIKEDVYDNQDQLCYALETSYDFRGRIRTQTDPMGRIKQFSYDANDNKTGEELFFQGKLIKLISSKYDHSNRLKEESIRHDNGLTFTTKYEYNHLGQRVAITDSYENKTILEYDAFGHEKKRILPFVETDQGVIQPMHQTNYDAIGRVVSELDSRGNITFYEYNVAGKPKKITHPDGTEDHFEYDLFGRLINKTDPGQIQTHYQYDPFGHVIEETQSNGNLQKVTRYRYKGKRLVEQIDPLGFSTSYEYDCAGRKCKEIKQTEQGPIETSFSYDSFGRLEKNFHPLEKIESFKYDVFDRIIEERIETKEGKLLKRTGYSYDVHDNQAYVFRFFEDGSFSQNEKVFGSDGYILVNHDAMGHETLWKYNFQFSRQLSNGLQQKCLESITYYPNGNSTREIQDALGRIWQIEERDASQIPLRRTQFLYDSEGNKISQITESLSPKFPQKKHEIQWVYDYRNRLTDIYEEGFRRAHYKYDEAGRLKIWEKPDGTTISYFYDSLGRMKGQKSSDKTIHYSYEYDNKERLIKVKDHLLNRSTYRTYDSQDHIIEEKLANGLSIHFTYDALGRPVEVKAPSIHLKYEFNALHLLSVSKLGKNGYTHQYLKTDLHGRTLKSQLIEQAGIVSYQYDLLDRYIKIHHPSWKQTLSGYDSMGNLKGLIEQKGADRKEISYNYDDLYQLLEDGFNTYQFDSIGNRLAKNEETYEINALNQLKGPDFVYDKNGNLIRFKKQTYTYDALNRLIKVETPEQTFEYTYDAFNRRLTKNKTRYLYQGDREIAAYEKDRLIEMRLLGRGKFGEIGSTVAMELDSKPYAVLTDHKGSITALIPFKDTEISSYVLTAPFGEPIKIEGELPPWTYASKRYDPETGFLYFGKRYYVPQLGRWLNTDPLNFADGPNLYAYVHNRPLALIDPFGLYAIDWSTEEFEIRSHELIQARVVIGAIRAGIRGIASHYLGRVGLSHFAAMDNFASLGNELDQIQYSSEFMFSEAFNLNRAYSVFYRGVQYTLQAAEGNGVDIRSLSKKAIQAVAQTGNQIHQKVASAFTKIFSDTSPSGQKDPVSKNESYISKCPQTGRPLPLPRTKDGVNIPSSDTPHTQIGWRNGRKGDYRQSRQWGYDGKEIKTTDWTDHGYPNNHTNPHDHLFTPNSTGGTNERVKARPFSIIIDF